MKHRGLYTKIEYSDEDGLFHGKIENVRDLVDFEGDTREEVEQAFHEAVDDYLEFCREVEKIEQQTQRN